MSVINNPTLNSSPAAPARSYFQILANESYMPRRVSRSILAVEDRLPGVLKPIWRGIMMLFWVEYSLRIAIGIIYCATLCGAKGMIIGTIVILLVDLETLIWVEERLPQWLQWVWRGLSMLYSLLFALQVPFWWTRLSIDVVLSVSSIWRYLAATG